MQTLVAQRTVALYSGALPARLWLQLKRFFSWTKNQVKLFSTFADEVTMFSGSSCRQKRSMWFWYDCLACRGRSIRSSWTASGRRETADGSDSTRLKLSVFAARYGDPKHTVCCYIVVNVLTSVFCASCRSGIIRMFCTKLCRRKIWPMSRILTWMTSTPPAGPAAPHREWRASHPTLPTARWPWLWDPWTPYRRRPTKSSPMNG